MIKHTYTHILKIHFRYMYFDTYVNIYIISTTKSHGPEITGLYNGHLDQT